MIKRYFLTTKEYVSTYSLPKLTISKNYSTYGFHGVIKDDKDALLPASSSDLQYIENQGRGHVYVTYNDADPCQNEQNITCCGVLTSSWKPVYFSKQNIYINPIPISPITFSGQQKLQYFLPFPNLMLIPKSNAISLVNVNEFLQQDYIKRNLDKIELLNQWQKYSKIIANES